MPTTDRPDVRSDNQQQAVNRIRKDLANGFSFVRGRETTEGLSALTLEEILEREIASIEQDGSEIRPGKIAAVRTIQQRVSAAVEQALGMSADAFDISASQPSPANTRSDGSGPSGEE